ncbi:MAG: hypothetical protein ACYS8K_04815, partial [Planctomycetota bacterium]
GFRDQSMVTAAPLGLPEEFADVSSEETHIANPPRSRNTGILIAVLVVGLLIAAAIIVLALR